MIKFKCTGKVGEIAENICKAFMRKTKLIKLLVGRGGFVNVDE